MKPSPRILVAEDERAMRIALTDCLESAGYRVIATADGETALATAAKQPPDLALLDVMMPRLDGFALCAELRRLGHCHPILLLTAKGQIDDRVHGLDVGADDYLVKPFSTAELLARIRALLRRVERDQPLPDEVTIGAARVDFRRQLAWLDGRELALTGKEFDMLRMLVEAAGEPVSRNDFLDRVWGYAAFPTTRTVDNHIANLRKKLEPDAESSAIKTIHGVGYRLEMTKP